MAKKTVDLTIRLKDGVTGVLSKIGGSMKRVVSGFKTLAVAGVAATTAIVGGLVAVAKAYSDQESVNKKLKDTFDAAGESGTKAVKKWGAWATAIQRVTALGDEEVMSLVTLAKTMGIANDKIADATKGAIGLSKAFGIDMNSAMKMVALATQGEYEMLQRYIPALRAATSEAEKAEIVQTAMARGFKIATGELDTLKGAWAALKGVVGDAMQEVGRVLFGDGGLIAGLEAVKNKIIDMTENGAITRWAEQAKVALDAVVQTIKILSNGGKGAKDVMGAVGNVLKAALLDAADRAADILKIAAPKIGEFIANGFTNAIKALNPFKAPEGQQDYMDAVNKLTASGALENEMGGFNRGAAKRNKEKIEAEISDATSDRKTEMDSKVLAALSVDGKRTPDALDNLARVLEESAKKNEDSGLKSAKKMGDFLKGYSADLPSNVETATEKGVESGVNNALRIDRALRNGINTKLTGSIYEDDYVATEEEGGMRKTEPFRYDVKPDTGNLNPFKPPRIGNLSMAKMPTSGFGPLNGVSGGPSDSDYLKQIADNTKGGLL